jgi:hypothetical protein
MAINISLKNVIVCPEGPGALTSFASEICRLDLFTREFFFQHGTLILINLRKIDVMAS